MNTEPLFSKKCEFVSGAHKSGNACSKRGNLEKKELKGNSVAKVFSESYIENTVPPTEQSWRRKSKHSIDEEEIVRIGSLEMEIGKHSSVPKHGSRGFSNKEFEDVNANKTSLVKNLSNLGDTNLQKTVADSKECKKKRAVEASSIPKKLKTENHASCENETNGNGNSEKNSNPIKKKGTSSEYSKVDSNLVYQANVMNEESKSKTRKSDEPEDEIGHLRAELAKKEKELIDIKQKLLQEQLCRTNKMPGDGDVTEEKLRLNEGGPVSLIPNDRNCTEASDKEMASQESHVIEITSDEETEYVEQDISDVEEQEKGHFLMSDKQSYTDQLENGNYNFVFIEIETILASNSRCKEITQIGGFKENTIGNSEARFFKAIVPKNLNYYLENYKLGGDLLQTLHMQKNDRGNFEFRNKFEILDEDRVAIQCVSEGEALEALSSYLADVENCIIASLNEENVKLLVKQIKLLGITNKRIHMDSVKGFCTWFSYLREAEASKEDLNQEFEDWYDCYVKSSLSCENVQKHADVVAKMVHDSITAVVKFESHRLLKASRSIKSLLSNETPEGDEPSFSEIQYLELFSSLRHDFPVRISLQKLQTYDISSEDEEGDARNRNERNIARGSLTQTGIIEHKEDLEEGEIDDVELHIDTSMEDLEEYFLDATQTSQDDQHSINPSEGSVLKCRHCQKSFKTYGMKIAHVLKCDSSPAIKVILPKSVPRKRITFESLPSTPTKFVSPLKSVSGVPVPTRVNSANDVPARDQSVLKICPVCNRIFSTVHGRNEHIIAKHNPNMFDQLPILPLELQCQKCYRWFRRVPWSYHDCFGENKRIPLFLECQHCNRPFKTYGEKTAHTLTCNPKNATEYMSANPVPNDSAKEVTLIETVRSVTTQDATSKTVSSNPTKDTTTSKPVIVNEVDIVKSKDQRPNYVLGYNRDQTDSGNRGLGRFPHPEAGLVNEEFGGFHHPPVYPVNGGFGWFSNPQAEPANAGFGEFHHPQAENVMGGFGWLPHPKANSVNGEFREFDYSQAGHIDGEFHHPQAGPDNGGTGQFPLPQAEPVNGGFGEFHHPQAENVMGGIGEFHHPQADPVNDEFEDLRWKLLQNNPQAGSVDGEFHHPQAGPDNGGFGPYPHPQAQPVDGGFGEFHYPQAENAMGGFGRFSHSQANHVKGEFGEFHNPQDDPVDEEFGDLRWKLLKNKY